MSRPLLFSFAKDWWETEKVAMNLMMLLLSIENASGREFVESLFERYSNDMYRVAKMIVREHQTAEDLVQTACINIIENIEKLRALDHNKVRPYVLAIVRNCAVNYVVKRNRRSKFSFLTDEDKAFDIVDIDYAIDDEIIRMAEIDALKTALALLPEREYHLLQMKYFDNYTDAQIAEVLCIQRQSVRFYLTKARRHLKDILMGDETHGPVI